MSVGTFGASPHAADAAAYQRLERGVRIARHVEGAVAGDVQRASRPHQFAHALFVDAAIGVQAADDDAGHAEVSERTDIGEHRTIFRLAIEKIAAAWPHDDMEGDGRALKCCAHRAEARRDAAFDQAGAEFDPIGAGGLRGQQAIDAFDADFDQRQASVVVGGQRGQSIADSSRPSGSIGPIAAKAG